MAPLQQKSHRTHAGLGHWRWQRFSALALIPVSLWAAFALIPLPAQDYRLALEWVSRPTSLVLITILFPVLYLHAALGLQVVLEDYVRNPLRQWCIRLSRVLALLASLATLAAAFSTY